MEFIKDVTTLEELKCVYRKLALEYHPDMGGTDKEMAQMNNEYEALFDKLKNTYKNKEDEYYQKETTGTPQKRQEIIHKLLTLKMEDISVGVIGTSLWVSGNIKPYKEELEASNMKWNNSEKSQYLAPDGHKKRSKKRYNMSDIHNMYGSQVAKGEQAKQKILTATAQGGSTMEQQHPTTHTLRVETEFFKAVGERRKTFETRKNDRNFQVGNILVLERYMNGMYLDGEYEAEVIYITDYAQREGYMVLGIKLRQ